MDVPRLVSHFGAGDLLPDPVLTEAMAALNEHYSPRRPTNVSARPACASTARVTTASPGTATAWGATIDRDTMVGILSVGEARVLSLRPKAGGDVLRFPLGHGDLIVMGGSCQRTHEHAI